MFIFLILNCLQSDFFIERMIEAVLKNPTLFKIIVDAVKDLIVYGPFYFMENSMCLQAMNESQVSLVVLNFNIGFFEVYRCDHPIILGIKVSDLSKIFKCAKSDDSCTIRFVDDSEFVTFIFENKKGRRHQASLKLFKQNYEYLYIAEHPYTCFIDMPSMELQKIFRDINSFSDTLSLNANNSEVSFKGEGYFATYKISYVRANYNDDDENCVKIIVNENVRAQFTLKYLLVLAKAATISTRVCISVADKLPILIEYKENNFLFSYYLAPIVE